MRQIGPVGQSTSVRRATAVALGALLAAGGTALAAPAAAAPPEERTAVIVQLEPGWDTLAESRRAAGNGGSVSYVYRSAFTGFAGSFSAKALSELRRNPAVASIEVDGVVTTADTQQPAPWGLDRIDQHTLPLSGSYTSPVGAGQGVTAYVVDTGLAGDVADLAGRVGTGAGFVNDGRGTEDCDGHGTHVAGTIAGTTHGVAKHATVVPVRVLDCTGSGSWSGVIAGLDWVAAHHPAGVPAVANLSLGGGVSASVDAAVKRVIDDGVTVAVAAGNSNTNACNSSPARVPAAITVGATDSSDRRASFSNYGACLDLFAPGVNIASTWINGTTNTISGTSMAAPHVAGAAAALLSRSGTTQLSPAAVSSSLVGGATTNAVKVPGNKSPNRLLFAQPS